MADQQGQAVGLTRFVGVDQQAMALLANGYCDSSGKNAAT